MQIGSAWRIQQAVEGPLPQSERGIDVGSQAGSVFSNSQGKGLLPAQKNSFIQETSWKRYFEAGITSGTICARQKSSRKADVCQARRMSNDFVFEDSDDQPVWEHDERLASTPSNSEI